VALEALEAEPIAENWVVLAVEPTAENWVVLAAEPTAENCLLAAGLQAYEKLYRSPLLYQ